MASKLPAREKAFVLGASIDGVSLEALAEPFQVSRGKRVRTWRNKRFQRRLAADTRKRLKQADQKRHRVPKAPIGITLETINEYAVQQAAAQANSERFAVDRATIMADHLDAMAARYNKQDFRRPGLADLEAMRDDMRQSAALAEIAVVEKTRGYAEGATASEYRYQLDRQVERNVRMTGGSGQEQEKELLRIARTSADAETRRLSHGSEIQERAAAFERLAKQRYYVVAGFPELAGPESAWVREQDTYAYAVAGLTRQADARLGPTTQSAAPSAETQAAAEPAPARPAGRRQEVSARVPSPSPSLNTESAASPAQASPLPMANIAASFPPVASLARDGQRAAREVNVGRPALSPAVPHVATQQNKDLGLKAERSL